MTAKTLQFVCHDTISIAEIESTVGTLSGLDEPVRQSLSRIYLDSFDRRFRARNLIIQCDEAGDGYTLILRDTSGKLRETARRIPRLARRPDDVIQPRMQSFLQDILGSRAMLPMMRCHVNMSLFSCRDNNRKIVARLSVEQVRVEGAPRNMPVLIKLDTVKGYGAESKRFKSAVRDKLPVRRLDKDSALLLEDAAGLIHKDYTAKPIIAISETGQTARALADLLSAYRLVMQANEEGITQDTDSEFLHDFRIAMRRSRSMLNAFRDAFQARFRVRFQRDFAWLSAQTSELRDLDVFTADLERVPRPGGSDEEAVVDGLGEAVAKHRLRASQKVRRMLASRRYRRFQDDWADTLVALRRGSSPDFGRRPILACSDKAIWRRYRKITKQVRSAHTGYAMEKLHELRKDCKKLRYLIEAFASLHPAKRVKAAVSELKMLQDFLGDICDRNAQKSMIAAWLGVSDYGNIDRAIRRTLKHLHCTGPDPGKDAGRKQLASVLSRFDSPENARLYAGLFKP